VQLPTAVLPKTPHSNSCKRVPNRPLRPRRGRFGIPGTCVQYPGLQGGGVLGDALTPGMPAGSMAASARGNLQPRCRGGGGVGRGKGCRLRHRSGGGPPASRGAHGRGRHSAAQRTCARRAGRPTRRTGGWVGLIAARRGACNRATSGVSNRRCAAATEDGAQARSPAGHRERVKPRKLLLAVTARHSGR